MPDVSSFSELAQEFDAVARKVIWPTMTTVDRQGRPRARIVHPVWDGPTGWLLTGRSSLKAKHLAQVPYVSISYVDTEGVSPTANQAYAECRAEWIDDAAEKTRIRDLFKSLPRAVRLRPRGLLPRRAGRSRVRRPQAHALARGGVLPRDADAGPGEGLASGRLTHSRHALRSHHDPAHGRREHVSAPRGFRRAACEVQPRRRAGNQHDHPGWCPHHPGGAAGRGADGAVPGRLSSGAC